MKHASFVRRRGMLRTEGAMAKMLFRCIWVPLGVVAMGPRRLGCGAYRIGMGSRNMGRRHHLLKRLRVSS